MPAAYPGDAVSPALLAAQSQSGSNPHRSGAATMEKPAVDALKARFDRIVSFVAAS
jgi:hypothetical protein